MTKPRPKGGFFVPSRDDAASRPKLCASSLLCTTTIVAVRGLSIPVSVNRCNHLTSLYQKLCSVGLMETGSDLEAGAGAGMGMGMGMGAGMGMGVGMGMTLIMT